MTKNKKLTKTIYKKIIKEEGGGGGETIHSSVLGVRLIGTNGKKYVSKVDNDHDSQDTYTSHAPTRLYIYTLHISQSF